MMQWLDMERGVNFQLCQLAAASTVK